jgi:hypothetical protein
MFRALMRLQKAITKVKRAGGNNAFLATLEQKLARIFPA